MNCAELRDYYELYAMGVAAEPEGTEIRAHLERDCEVCVPEMKRARQIVALLGGTAAAAAPSAKLRRRILASVGFEQRRFGWAPFLAFATALCLFAAIYFSSRERGYADEVAILRDQMRQQTIELTQLNEAMTILNGPDTKVVTFGAGPKGKVFVSPSQGVLLMASNLPVAPAGKLYEMWLIPKGGTPAPAGLFQAQPNGSAMHIQGGPVAPGVTVAVTLENEAGATTPTMPILIVASPQ